MFGSHIKKINLKDFKNAVEISTICEADALFESLESSVKKNRYITIDRSMHDYGIEQIIMRFLDKYKKFIEFYYVDMKFEYGKTYIKLKDMVSFDEQGGYSDLESSYSEHYYMNDCGGYDDFVKSNGTKIEQRLQDVCNLINPTQDDKILDVGCGRGELSYVLATMGADVTGLDYSEDAIKIAKRTYDGRLDNLKYIREDIFKVENLDVFDKIVMADVVEHIEQDILEKIFEKIALSISEKGVLVIHTAPNKDYYEKYYPLMRQKASECGCYLPKNPRSYYEQLMHINEQSPDMLRDALNKYFKYVLVWTGYITEMDAEKTFDESCKDNQIFALACNEKSVFDKVKDEVSSRPIFEKCSVEIEAEDIVMNLKEHEKYIQITLENNGDEIITSRRKYPINLAYHIIDKDNNMIVFDGERTLISEFIRKGKKNTINMKVLLPNDLKSGNTYYVDITLVAEGCFWLDQEGMNKKRVLLTIK